MGADIQHCVQLRTEGVIFIYGDIVLYSTGCPKCEVLKKKLAEKDIPYTENNSVDEMLALGITQVPVLGIGDELKNFTESLEWIRNR